MRAHANHALVEVSDDTHLKEMIDYGAFPSWDYSASPAVYTRLRLGPPPSVSVLPVSQVPR